MRLIQAREALALSQTQAAKRMRIGQGTLSRIENGESMASTSIAVKLMRLLGVSLDDILAPPTATSSNAAPVDERSSRPPSKPRRARTAA